MGWGLSKVEGKEKCLECIYRIVRFGDDPNKFNFTGSSTWFISVSSLHKIFIIRSIPQMQHYNLKFIMITQPNFDFPDFLQLSSNIFEKKLSWFVIGFSIQNTLKRERLDPRNIR